MYHRKLIGLCALAIVAAGAVAYAQSDADMSASQTQVQGMPVSVELDMSPFGAYQPGDAATSDQADQPFVPKQSSNIFHAEGAGQLQSQVAVPMPATSGAALALLASYGWGISCRRWRRRKLPVA
jgi:hypothetical protein